MGRMTVIIAVYSSDGLIVARARSPVVQRFVRPDCRRGRECDLSVHNALVSAGHLVDTKCPSTHSRYVQSAIESGDTVKKLGFQTPKPKSKYSTYKSIRYVLSSLIRLPPPIFCVWYRSFLRGLVAEFPTVLISADWQVYMR